MMAESAPIVLHELRAPPGWTAGVLQMPLPLPEADRPAYRDAVSGLLRRIPAFAAPHPEELFLLFERCRPAIEIPILQENARLWMPQLGLGVWLDRDPPTTWTAEEFTTAAPGTLRPVVDRVVRIGRRPEAQRSAWQHLLGSGALIRTSHTAPERFLPEATAVLQPRISDRSLTSFPFYVPLVTAAALQAPSPAFRAPLADLLPQTDAYLRESVEDGGLLMAVRQPPAAFWPTLLKPPYPFEVLRLAVERTA